MRAVLLLAACAVSLAQPGPVPSGPPDPLTRAYAALKVRQYDTAIAAFLQAIDLDKKRASIRKDLAYTYLKIGENDLAREQFQQAMLLDSKDLPVAMEYAFLCYEGGPSYQAQARRIFDRIRQGGSPSAPVADKAFHNIDDPLAAGIDRWQKAISMGADTFDAHYQLASLAEQRGLLPLAAEHYLKAWRILPDRRSVLVDLGRVWQAQGRQEDANAALLAASRGGEPAAIDSARELLPKHYPYPVEFRHALDLDFTNGELRRELGFLLLSMGKPADAEKEFRIQTQSDPKDMLSAAQLGFMLQTRGEQAAARPLFDRVLAGKDLALANRVRAVLHMPQVGSGGAVDTAHGERVDPKTMAGRSMKAGYIQDAVRYFRAAHEADPSDYSVMLGLAHALNILGQDPEAVRWFGQARLSPDPAVAAEADKAWRNLRAANEPVQLSGWAFPLFSTRWHDLFGYAQLKAEFRTRLPIRPYLSVRFVGDSRVSETVTALSVPRSSLISPQSALGGPAAEPPVCTAVKVGFRCREYLSEDSLILAAGVASRPWHGVFLWGEVGNSMSYVNGHKLPDYRGGLSGARGWGRTLSGESTGLFADTTLDAVFISRFNNDLMVYSQSRGGYTFQTGSIRWQLFWNANLTLDDQWNHWANFVETGPGIRWTAPFLPSGMYFTASALRGEYLVNAGNPLGADYSPIGPNFNDLRAGVWYAFSR